MEEYSLRFETVSESWVLEGSLPEGFAENILREAERHHAEGTLGLAVSPSQDVVEI